MKITLTKHQILQRVQSRKGLVAGVYVCTKDSVPNKKFKFFCPMMAVIAYSMSDQEECGYYNQVGKLNAKLLELKNIDRNGRYQRLTNPTLAGIEKHIQQVEGSLWGRLVLYVDEVAEFYRLKSDQEPDDAYIKGYAIEFIEKYFPETMEIEIPDTLLKKPKVREE